MSALTIIGVLILVAAIALLVTHEVWIYRQRKAARRRPGFVTHGRKRVGQ